MLHRRLTIYFTAAFLSIFLSCWIAGKESVINSDAICYLQSAATMPAGFQVAMHLCDQAKWPFYSALIFGLASLTKLSYITAANVLNGIFSLLSVITFITIVRLLNNKPRVLWLAALVILLASELNGVRTYIIRDHGFWAFYLLSILFLLQYYRTRLWFLAWGWGLSLIVATLFRLEGAIFLVVIPFSVWLMGKPQNVSRITLFLQLNTITFIIGVFLCFWFIFHPMGQDAGRLPELQFQLLHGIHSVLTNFNLKAGTVARFVLSPDSAQDARLILFLMLVSWYVLSVVSNLSLIYSVLVVYAWKNKNLSADKSTHWVLWSYIVVNIMVTGMFLVEHLFLSKRYLIALSLVLMLWVPFALEHLLQQWQQRKWPFILAVFFIIISSLGGIFDFGYSKQYIHQAGQWLEENAPPQATIYSNDYHVMYYSKHFGNQIFAKFKEFSDMHFIANGQWEKYDYVALRVNDQEVRSSSGILAGIKLIPVKIFANKRGDQVRIYRGLPE